MPDDKTPHRILVVDDELRMCLSLKALLERKGYDVVTAASGKDAMERLPTGRFSMVITDIRMPGSNGIDILQRAKEIDPHIVVILMTGFASLESAKAAINRGAFDYLTKPLEFDDLLRSIWKGLASRSAEIEKHHLLELLSTSNNLLEERVNQLHALYKSAGVLSGTTNLETLLNQIINLVTGVVGANAGSIMSLDKTGKYLAISAAIGLDDDIIADTKVMLGEGVAGYVAAQRDSVIIDDISTDPRFKSANRSKYETSSAISTPIIHRDDLLGVINLNNKEDKQNFTIDDLRLLETFASHAAIAIVNAALFEENREKLNELTILHRIAARLSSSRSESEIFASLFQGIRSIVHADFCYFLTLSDDDGVLKVRFAEDSEHENSRKLESMEINIPFETAASGDIADKQKWIEQFIKDIFSDNSGNSISAFISVPVSVENFLSGFLCVGCYNGEQYSESAKRLISIIASQTASLYERQRSIINGSKLLTMGKMVSELTHDLKKPLTNMRGLLQIVESRWDKPGAREEFLGTALQEVDRLTDLVKEMLDFADPGKYKRSYCDVIPMIDRALSLLEPDFKKSSIKVKKKFTDDPPKIFINETEIFEAFLNIILNAVESMHDGGSLGIEIRRCKPEDSPKPFLRIGISDEGCGVPKDKLNHVFERYYTTKEDGTGLGLALVERVMSSHDGKAFIESEINKGTTIYLDFPINN